jgi:hypothetical protein
MKPRPRTARKLLVASVGVAAIAYAGCEKKMPTEVVGNLVPMPMDAAAPPPPLPEAGTPHADDGGPPRLPPIQVK